MAENEVVVETEVQPQPETAAPEKKKGNFKASAKEWLRKRIVKLKRKPQSIILWVLVITAALWLIWLYTFSRTIYENQAVSWCGLEIFVNTLLSILILALFGSAFPKRKKPNYVFIGLLFAFMAAMIICDVMYYVEMGTYLHTDIASGGSGYTASQLAEKPFMENSLTLAIVHIVLIGISAILLGTLPLYRKLILKINTRKEVDSTEIKEQIDFEEE